MTDALLPGIQGRRATVLGWITFIGFFVLFWNILQLPRTALDARQGLRIFHDSLGLIIMVLAAVQLLGMIRGPDLSPPEGLPENSFGFNRALLAAIYVSLFVTGAVGFLFAFGEWNRPVILFGAELPQLVAEGDRIRKPFGYVHSALGFYYMMLATIWLAYGFYQHLRYKVGLSRLFPGSRV